MQQAEQADAVRFDGENQAERGPVYQVLVTNISWNPDTVKNYRSRYDEHRELPQQTSFDFTGARYEKLMKLRGQAFKDEVEKTAFEVLTYKYGHEVVGASVWLPLEG